MKGELKGMQAASARPPKPPKPLLDSESEAAKHIERLKQANREWQARYRVEKHYFEEEKKRISRLPFFTRSLAFAALEATSESSWPDPQKGDVT